ncbi:threonine aldolase [Cryptococcus bacillisporus CA1873]|uniref:Threonine aldolase n=2 Tax=Cryptococcus gattii TaxID=552467 RepID=A0A0D0VTS1_CRYGA|nr:threonine aldolase [Cryptococcus bacillisporus CA1280]KIR67650.1 threonine aldolase [Cryptococcus bacillisporus CA1873]|eukprot:KIR67650.1 threonine aldolase [Cryptococcus gattii CA1873]
MVRIAYFKYACLMPTRISLPAIFPKRLIVTTTPIAMPIASSKPFAEVTLDVGGQANVDQLHRVSRDFRSDTITIPTDAQLLYSLKATRGDDVYGEDPSTAALEKRIAKLTGKEAAMFAVSGTMTNQLAIRTHMKQPPHSVITDWRAHVHKMEAGGIAMFSQATTHQIVPENGLHLTVVDIEPALQLGTNIHIAPTKLICLENTLSGMIFPQEEIVKIGEMARKHDIGMHLDGARIWNVAADVIAKRGLNPNKEEDLQTVLTELIAPFDSASLCLSKGLGAPIGSALVGTKEFIDRAKWFRKAFGGGIRQAGGIAASADYAITHHFPRLVKTHELASRLEHGLRELGCDILAPVDTNMVFFQPKPIGLPLDAVMARLAALPDPIIIGRERCVVHHQICPQAIEDFIGCIAEMKKEKEENGECKVTTVGQEEKDKLYRFVGPETNDETSEAELRKKAALGY